MKALLISNSGRPFLAHCKEELYSIIGGGQRVGFVSAAAFMDPNEYFQKVKEALSDAKFSLEHLDVDDNPLDVLKRVDAVFVGGGNTYRLLKKVSEAKLIPAIRERVQAGMPYVGWSAGANLAGPTILTTNDWNVVGLTHFDALALVPFNINPHYMETDPAMAKHSETRDERIAEYHKVQKNPVLGIEEQTMVLAEDSSVRVIGQGRVRKFLPNENARDFRHGDVI